MGKIEVLSQILQLGGCVVTIKLTVTLFLIFGSFAINEWIEKKFKIPKDKGFWQRPVNDVHKWLSRILFVVFITLIILSYRFNFNLGNFYIFYFLFALEILRAIMEWKYQKQTKRYLLTLSNLIIWFFIIMIWVI
jgi:hypothetical protein